MNQTSSPTRGADRRPREGARCATPAPPVGRERPRAVSKSRRCPVCGGDHKCSTLPDGRVFCGRRHGPVEGWRHLGACKNPTWDTYAPIDGTLPATPLERSPAAPPMPVPPPAEIGRLARRCQRQLTQGQLTSLARELGVAERSLSRLGLGWATAAQLEAAGTNCAGDGRWTFPMFDAARNVVGIRLRRPNGGKYAVAGSDGSGLFLPVGLPPRPWALVACEGPTSCAALLTAGFAAVGRPSDRAGAAYLAALVARLRPGVVVVLGENDRKANGDWPGRDGAVAISAELASVHRDVRVELPSEWIKDARDWHLAGRLRVELLRAIYGDAPSAAQSPPADRRPGW